MEMEPMRPFNHPTLHQGVLKNMRLRRRLGDF